MGREKWGRGRGEAGGDGVGATSNASAMSQAVSPGDIEWKTLRRVEVSRARLATASEESRRWHSKKHFIYMAAEERERDLKHSY